MQKQRYIQKIAGGWNYDVAPHLLDESEYSIFKNVDMEERTILQTRQGCDMITTTAIASAKIDGMFFDKQRETPRLYTACNGTVYYSEDFGVTYATISGKLTVGIEVNFEYNGRHVYVITSKDILKRIQGNALSEVGSSVYQPPKGSSMLYWNHRLFIADGNRLYYNTYVDNYELFASYLDMKSNIKGIKTLLGNPYIFCENGVYQLEYDSLFLYNAAKTSVNVAPISSRSIISGYNEITFMADDGIYLFNGSVASKVSGGKFDTFFSTIPDKSSVVGFMKNDVYYWAMPYEGLTNGALFVWDRIGNRFGLHDGPVGYGRVYCPDCFGGRTLFGDSSGNVYELFRGTDDNSATIAFEVQRSFDMGNVFKRKSFWRIYISAEKTGSFNLTASHGVTARSLSSTSVSLVSDNRWGTGLWGTMKWGDEPRDVFEMPVASGYSVGDKLYLKLNVSSSSYTVKIHEYMFDWKPITGRR